MNLRQIADEWFDRTVPWPEPDPHRLRGHCVQFVRWLLNNFWKLPQWAPVRGAGDFWEAYENDPALNAYWDKIPCAPGFVPKEGDVAVWNHRKGGGFGHIGVVLGENNCARFFDSVESNWKPFVVTTVRHNYNDVSGFFRRKENV